MAWPTSAGSGCRHSRRPYTRSAPEIQSMSTNICERILPERNPRRANNYKTAR